MNKHNGGGALDPAWIGIWACLLASPATLALLTYKRSVTLKTRKTASKDDGSRRQMAKDNEKGAKDNERRQNSKWRRKSCWL